MLIVILVALVGVVVGAFLQARSPDGSVSINEASREPRPLTPFALVDHNDRPFNLEQLEGHWTFLFFGYTHCPDVCPFTLAEMDRVHQRLAETTQGRQDARFVFVSVDPQRDRGSLKSYVTYFNENFLGVTGDVDGLTKQLGVKYEYVETTPSDYLVNHTASIFLIDPEGRRVAVFKAPHEADVISKQYLQIRANTPEA